jgi:CheY-like chemotaxis protein
LFNAMNEFMFLSKFMSLLAPALHPGSSALPAPGALRAQLCPKRLATSGEAALQRARQALPDIVLLDAMMPGMDGFEDAKRLKASPETAHIPIVFMTGLTETEYLVAALEAGGVDYVTKPIKPKEVMARMSVHLQGARRARQDARQAGQARSALDAFGYASITVRLLGKSSATLEGDGKLIWQTPLARELLLRYFGTSAPVTPEPVLSWLRRHARDAPSFEDGQVESPRFSVELGPRRLTFRLHQQTGDGQSVLKILVAAAVTG